MIMHCHRNSPVSYSFLVQKYEALFRDVRLDWSATGMMDYTHLQRLFNEIQAFPDSSRTEVEDFLAYREYHKALVGSMDNFEHWKRWIPRVVPQRFGGQYCIDFEFVAAIGRQLKSLENDMTLIAYTERVHDMTTTRILGDMPVSRYCKTKRSERRTLCGTLSSCLGKSSFVALSDQDGLQPGRNRGRDM